MFLPVDVRCTHLSNEGAQDNVIMFKHPFILQGLETKGEAVLQQQVTKWNGEYLGRNLIEEAVKIFIWPILTLNKLG